MSSCTGSCVRQLDVRAASEAGGAAGDDDSAKAADVGSELWSARCVWRSRRRRRRPNTAESRWRVRVICRTARTNRCHPRMRSSDEVPPKRCIATVRRDASGEGRAQRTSAEAETARGGATTIGCIHPTANYAKRCLSYARASTRERRRAKPPARDIATAEPSAQEALGSSLVIVMPLHA